MSNVIDFKKSVIEKKNITLNDRQQRWKAFCRDNYYIPYEQYKEPKELDLLIMGKPRIVSFEIEPTFE